jgi:hypothetical protein
MRIRPTRSNVVIGAPVPVAEMARAVDLKTLPRMPDADVATHGTAVLVYVAPGDPTSALAFSAKQLGERGWHESRAAGPKFVSNVFASAAYEKSGFTLAFTAKQTPGERGMVTVMLQNMGTLDTRILPMHGGGMLILGGRTSSTYLTPAGVGEVVDDTRKALGDLGWIEHPVVNTRPDADLERRTLTFTKNGTSLAAVISVARALKGKTLVHYTTAMSAPEE